MKQRKIELIGPPEIGGWYDEEAPSTVTPEQAAQIAQENVALKAQVGALEAVKQTADKFGLDIPSFAENAEGAFSTLGSLIEAGVLNDDGSLNEAFLAQRQVKETPPSKTPVTPKVKGEPSEKELVLTRALEETIGRLKKVEEDQLHLVQMGIIDRLQRKHSGLTDDDAIRVITAATTDKSKTIDQHAQTYLGQKNEARDRFKAEVLKEYGMNKEELDRNRLKEQTAEGGAAALFKTKKISFRGGKEAVTPMQAMKEYMQVAKLGG